ncbi:hypothetical protein F8M41_022857 [Gigaspora margarita]|uniref:Uncharacterized protein n=1 Tax=Gigaspora margarita TaxID=4874 RepID=A0A8H4EHQ5_GIGMA|nr:hypothetical protein F8M41_022857 [Gigaspora margarita]
MADLSSVTIAIGKSKRKVKSKDDCQDGSTPSEDTIEASISQEIQEHKTNVGDITIDTQTKAYVDAIICSTATAIMENTRQYMDQQLEIQKEWNERCIETINQRFAQLEQANLLDSRNSSNQASDNKPSTRQQPNISRTHIMQATSTEGNMELQEGNFPSTPIINSLITRINLGDSQIGETGSDDIKSVKYKFTSRRFPALSYLSLKPLSDVQGITNKEAIITRVPQFDLIFKYLDQIFDQIQIQI